MSIPFPDDFDLERVKIKRLRSIDVFNMSISCMQRIGDLYAQLTSRAKIPISTIRANLDIIVQSPMNGVYLAMYDGQIVATASVYIKQHPWATVAEIENVVTEKSFRGHGIGRKMMERLEAEVITGEFAKLIPCKIILLSRSDAQGFYGNLDYQKGELSWHKVLIPKE
jgi:GNAT superfamily N-acetyltransferase